MFKRLVNIVQYVTLAAAALAIVMMLSAYDPGPGPSVSVVSGAEIYAQSCASCHGAEGGGVYAPELAGVVSDNFPNVDDEIQIVRAGRAGMPSFADTLTDDQIVAVVEFTRTDLGADDTGGDDVDDADDAGSAGGRFAGESIYSASCASCHGADGQGGIGPELGGGAMIERFSAPQDQVDIVVDGRDGMPSFEGRLSTEEIDQVVEYTRKGLG